MSRVYLKAEQKPVTMPTHFTERHCIYYNELISKPVFAGASLSAVHTLLKAAEAFSVAGHDLRKHN